MSSHRVSIIPEGGDDDDSDAWEAVVARDESPRMRAGQREGCAWRPSRPRRRSARGHRSRLACVVPRTALGASRLRGDGRVVAGALRCGSKRLPDLSAPALRPRETWCRPSGAPPTAGRSRSPTAGASRASACRATSIPYWPRSRRSGWPSLSADARCGPGRGLRARCASRALARPASTSSRTWPPRSSRSRTSRTRGSPGRRSKPSTPRRWRFHCCSIAIWFLDSGRVGAFALCAVLVARVRRADGLTIAGSGSGSGGRTANGAPVWRSRPRGSSGRRSASRSSSPRSAGRRARSTTVRVGRGLARRARQDACSRTRERSSRRCRPRTTSRTCCGSGSHSRERSFLPRASRRSRSRSCWSTSSPTRHPPPIRGRTTSPPSIPSSSRRRSSASRACPGAPRRRGWIRPACCARVVASRRAVSALLGLKELGYQAELSESHIEALRDAARGRPGRCAGQLDEPRRLASLEPAVLLQRADRRGAPSGSSSTHSIRALRSPVRRSSSGTRRRSSGSVGRSSSDPRWVEVFDRDGVLVFRKDEPR